MSNVPAQPVDPRQQSITGTATAAPPTDNLPPIISEILSAMPQKSGLSNRSRYELLKSQIAPGCTDDELALFLDVANARGLSPWARQIFARKQRTWDNDKREYVMKMIIITSIDGFRLKAARTKEHTRTSDAEFTSGMTVTPLNPAGIEKCSITVFRKGEPFTATVYWSELSQTYKKDGIEHLSSTWQKMPHGMLEKTNEAKALRRAFPEEFADLYTDDEIGPIVATDTAPPRPNGGTAARAGKESASMPAPAIPAPTSQTATVMPKPTPPAVRPEWTAKRDEAVAPLNACKDQAELGDAFGKLPKMLPKGKAPPAIREEVGATVCGSASEVAREGAAECGECAVSEFVRAYRDALRTVAMAATVLSVHDIPQLLADIERADTVGPLLDPTLWIQKKKAMEEDREMFQAARALHRLGTKLARRRETTPQSAARE